MAEANPRPSTRSDNRAPAGCVVRGEEELVCQQQITAVHDAPLTENNGHITARRDVFGPLAIR
jgi:hypothetical protein